MTAVGRTVTESCDRDLMEDLWWLVTSNSCLCSITEILAGSLVLKHRARCVIGVCFTWLKSPLHRMEEMREKRPGGHGQLFFSVTPGGWTHPQVGYGEADPAEPLFSLHGSARQRHLNVCNGLTENGGLLLQNIQNSNGSTMIFP